MDMYYIVGLGNPGKEYKNTRHNVGFTLLEAFVANVGLPSLHTSKTYNGLLSQGMVAGQEVTVFLPETFMNLSGGAVKKLVPKDELEKMVVVYDDIDLPLSSIKISFGRGAGGHNGIKSIVETLGTQDFLRIRVGIAQKSIWTGKLKRPKGEALASFVLGTFSSREQKELETVAQMMPEVFAVFVNKGKEAVMNKFN